MTLILWHNPRCSKSRETLALLESHGHRPTIRLYLEDPPAAGEIRAALTLLGQPALALVRTGEVDFRELGLNLDASEDDLIAAMATHPRLIERPVLIANGKAALGRPPTAVLAII